MSYYLIIVLVVLVIVLTIADRWKPRNLVKLDQHFGIDWKYLPIIGHAYKIITSNEEIFQVLDNVSSQAFRRKDGTLTCWLLNRLILVIADPIQANSVFKIGCNKSFIRKFFDNFIGNGSIYAPNEIWHRRRKILAPAFTTTRVSKFVKLFETNAKILVEQFEIEVGRGNFSCWDYVNRYTLDSICETTLGVTVGALRGSYHPFFKAYQEYFKNIVIRISRPWLHINMLYKYSTIYKRQKDNEKIICDFVDNIIYRKKSVMRNSTNNDDLNNDLKTFLDLMIECSEETGKGFTHEELREELLVLIVAGTDTSAVAICFTTLLLSQHQDVQDKVYTELEEVLGDTNRPIEFEDLLKLKYMDATIKETLRLYPPVPGIIRDAAKDFVLSSGAHVPGGCDIFINISGMHRNPQYWGQNSEDFKPERFLSDETRVPGTFIPFSYGPRSCIGNVYAMLSMKIALATILRRYRLLPATSFKYDKKNPLRLSFEIMTKHVDNFEIQLENRHQ